eukprot:4311969-Karenia_brevis.AAC.1
MLKFAKRAALHRRANCQSHSHGPQPKSKRRKLGTYSPNRAGDRLLTRVGEGSINIKDAAQQAQDIVATYGDNGDLLSGIATFA